MEETSAARDEGAPPCARLCRAGTWTGKAKIKKKISEQNEVLERGPRSLTNQQENLKAPDDFQYTTCNNMFHQPSA